MRIFLIATLLVAAGTASAAEPEKWPLVIPAPHGSVILPNENAKRAHDEFRYAAIRRVDNMLYISGVIIARREGEGRDAAAFRLQVDRGLQRLKGILEAAGATFQDVVMINSFHVWQGPDFEGTKDRAFRVVRGSRRQLPEAAVSGVDGRRHDGTARQRRHRRSAADRAGTRPLTVLRRAVRRTG